MKEHFVTIFDSLFLPQGIALHCSMERHIDSYVLWVICVDEEAYRVLTQLNLPNLQPLDLRKLETSELLTVKANRTRGEYCWTLTPFSPRFVFDADQSVSRVTYIDADIWFRNQPDLIFSELEQSAKSVLITDHSYAAIYDQSAVSGQYCVQFITFIRDQSEPVRKWWEDRCIEWCYARSEDGKCGDQKYLDGWPLRFKAETHVLVNKELALGPWNASRFPYGQSVFYHFHGLRLTSERSVNMGSFILPRVVVDNIYQPYLKDLRDAILQLNAVGVIFRAQAKPTGFLTKIFNRLLLLRQALNLLWPQTSLRLPNVND